jgi:hypothetical protein
MHDHTQFFVGWGTLSLINAGLAQSKGRSGLLWWLLSLFIGPIATFLIVVLPAIHRPLPLDYQRGQSKKSEKPFQAAPVFPKQA